MLSIAEAVVKPRARLRAYAPAMTRRRSKTAKIMINCRIAFAECTSA
jgi:hypothetical protein